MRFIYTLLLATLFLIPSGGTTGIEFFKGTFEEAKELAAKDGKLIFVDAYTTWCGPCKRMSRMIFTQEEVGQYYNETFINIKLDMEKGEGRKFQQKYSVSAFPTLLFIDHSGKVLKKKVGGLDGPNLIKLGKHAASKSDVTAKLDKAYADGQRDPAFMASYVMALSKAKRPLIKKTNEYLKSQKNLTSEENLKVLYYGSIEADSRIFNLMVKNKRAIIGLFGREGYDKQIVAAGNATVDKAIKFENVDLLEEAVDKVKRYAPEPGKYFEPEARMTYYAKMDDAGKYLKSAKNYAKLGTEKKYELSNYILRNMKHHPSLMLEAEKWSVDAATKEKTEPHCFIAAQVLYALGKYKSAKTFAEQALSIAEESDSQTTPHIKKLIQSLDDKLGA